MSGCQSPRKVHADNAPRVFFFMDMFSLFLSRFRSHIIMFGVVACGLCYVLMFMFVPDGVDSLSSQEVNQAYSHLQSKAVRLSTGLSAIGVVSPVSLLERLKTAEKSVMKNEEGSMDDEDYSCTDSVSVLLAGLRTGNMSSLRMIDASTKLPAGLLEGNLVDLGSFDECLAVTVTEGPVFYLGQHCLVKTLLEFQTIPDFASAGVIAALGNSLSYTFSLCLPSTCSATTLDKTLASVAAEVNNLTASENFSIQFSVQESDCHIRVRPPLDPAEVVGIVITVGFVVLVAISTIIELTLKFRENDAQYRDQPRCIKLAVAFSVYSNVARLLDTRGADGTIQVLHSIKFLSIAWVALGHRVKFSVEQPLINLLQLADYIENYTSMIILNATLSVDVFFVISGILNTYIYMNVSQGGGKSFLSHLVAYVHRYIRLTPAYAVMILVTATWLYRTGDGPLWDRLVGDAKTECSLYWWSGLLYINNYYNPNNSCLMQSWYLAADMQLFWLSPLVLYSLWRWPRVGLFKLLILVILSIIVPFLVAYIDEIKTPIPISFDQSLVRTQMAELYLPTHTKTISYVIGILTGYLLHMIRAKRVTFRISRMKSGVLWVLATVSMLGSVFGGYGIFQLDNPYDRWDSSIYIALYRFFWSIGVAWFIVACTTGHGGFIDTIFSWKVWMPLGRLTYCIYLTHVAVILYSIGTIREPQYFSYYHMVMKFLGELVIATFLAAILSLAIESPMMVLEKVLFRRGAEKSVTPRNRTATSISLPKALNEA